MKEVPQQDSGLPVAHTHVVQVLTAVFIFLAALLIGGLIFLYSQNPLVEPTTSSQDLMKGKYDSISGFYFDLNGEQSAYSQKEGEIYFKGSALIEGADVATFSVLCGGTSDTVGIAKDKTNVYYKSQKIEGADATTFETFNYPADEYFSAGCEYYSKDKNNVYYIDKIVSTNPDTFSKLSWNESLWMDGESIFNSWGEVLSIDAEHFVPVNIKESEYLYAKDSYQFYRSSTQSEQIDPIKNSDPASFEFLNDDTGNHSLYAKDKNIIYSFAESLGYPGPNLWTTDGSIDPKSTSLAVNVLGKKVICAITVGDRAFMYGFNEVPNVDTASFVITDNQCMYAKDKNREYKISLERDGEVVPQ